MSSEVLERKVGSSFELEEVGVQSDETCELKAAEGVGTDDGRSEVTGDPGGLDVVEQDFSLVTLEIVGVIAGQ